MKSFTQYRIPALALALYFIFYTLCYNQLQYLLDSDAVAYLTIARRVADGDWFRSINGLWSPLNSWLLVPFIRNGIDAWTAAKGLNALFGGILILQFWYLLRQLNFSKQQVAEGALLVVIPICFFAYFQMFGDVLQLIFAMAYLSFALRKNFMQHTKWVILAAVVMGVGYYAKAYSLVFFVLHFSVLAIIAFRKKTIETRKIILNYILGIGVIVIIVLPWAFQLQKKYGEFALTGMAGKLNMSWYINSGKTFKDSIGLMIPPAYDDSPTFWEDPYLSAGELSTPLSSVYLFKRWVLRVGHTCLMAVKSVSEISLFFIPIFLIFFYRLFKRKKITTVQSKIIWAIILLPLGYLAMHIETRYIWLLMFLIIILGFYLLQNWKWDNVQKRIARTFFFLSVLAMPCFMLFMLEGKNKYLFSIAKELKENNIKGKIVTNHADEGSFWVVSYLAGLNNYTIEKNEFELEELINEMKRYDIRYYYHFRRSSYQRFGDHEERFKKLFQPAFEPAHPSLTLYELKD